MHNADSVAWLVSHYHEWLWTMCIHSCCQDQYHVSRVSITDYQTHRILKLSVCNLTTLHSQNNQLNAIHMTKNGNKSVMALVSMSNMGIVLSQAWSYS